MQDKFPARVQALGFQLVAVVADGIEPFFLFPVQTCQKTSLRSRQRHPPSPKLRQAGLLSLFEELFKVMGWTHTVLLGKNWEKYWSEL